MIKDKLDTTHQALSEEFITINKDLVNWNYISKYQTLKSIT